jgi:hypothetical protein
MGNEPLGRIRTWIGGQPFDTWEEPSCLFSALADELLEKGASSYTAWHPSLEHKSPVERFQVLDNLIYNPEYADRVPSTLDIAPFLTNTVECFDGVKAFALTPSDGFIQLLICDQANKFASVLVDKNLLRRMAVGLTDWIRSQRRDA